MPKLFAREWDGGLEAEPERARTGEARPGRGAEPAPEPEPEPDAKTERASGASGMAPAAVFKGSRNEMAN